MKKISKAILREIIELKKKGLSIKAISKIIKKTESQIYYKLRKTKTKC